MAALYTRRLLSIYWKVLYYTRESCRGARTCVFVCDAFKHTALRVECASYVKMTARPIVEYVGVGKRHISIAQKTRMVVLVRAALDI